MNFICNTYIQYLEATLQIHLHSLYMYINNRCIPLSQEENIDYPYILPFILYKPAGYYSKGMTLKRGKWRYSDCKNERNKNGLIGWYIYIYINPNGCLIHLSPLSRYEKDNLRCLYKKIGKTYWKEFLQTGYPNVKQSSWESTLLPFTEGVA